MCYSVFLYERGSAVLAPHWWLNFLDDAQHRRVYSNEEVNLALMDYSAQFVSMNYDTSGHRYLDFYDEQAYVWFLLRWS